MSIRNTSFNYGSIAKFFHWTISMLIIIMLVVGFLMSYIKDPAVFGQVIGVHKLIGLLILTLMVLRLLWALSNPKPGSAINTPEWQHFTERFMQFLLYAVIIAMPLAGWLMAVSAGYPPKFLSWTFNLPVEHSQIAAKFWGAIHYTLAFVIIALVAVHAAAALYHHVIKKDNILRRMMPGK